jgi:hypothetical protein
MIIQSFNNEKLSRLACCVVGFFFDYAVWQTSDVLCILGECSLSFMVAIHLEELYEESSESCSGYVKSYVKSKSTLILKGTHPWPE